VNHYVVDVFQLSLYRGLNLGGDLVRFQNRFFGINLNVEVDVPKSGYAPHTHAMRTLCAIDRLYRVEHGKVKNHVRAAVHKFGVGFHKDAQGGFDDPHSHKKCGPGVDDADVKPD
jgi:hypothetical protein